MEFVEHRQVMILGGGPAGFTAALYTARADLKPLLVTGLILYGQASQTHCIENYPGFPEGVGGRDLGQRLDEQAKRFGTEIIYDTVQCVDLQQQPFKVCLSSTNYTADSLIISMGADSRKLGVPGEREFTGRGVSYCATCDGAFYKDKDIHIVGGGDSAVEEALFLTRFARSITIIHRRDQLRAGAILENRARSNPKIHFIWDTVVREIIGADSVSHLKIENVKTGQQDTIPSDGIFISIGHTPNTGVLEGQVKLTEFGTIEIDNHMETSVKGVFAAGEIADPYFRQVVTSAGMGAAAAISATKYLSTL
ncbi:MAG TPA: thioredoxin-disulfide reductase [Anaerolineaceae bacterium]|nr:thioredoxin-disulfide reductase [Anaerolineaceae bacterium]